MGFTNSEAVSVLASVMGGELGLLTAASDNGGYTEVSVDGYKRVSSIGKITTDGRKCSNANLILMFEARGAATADYFGFFSGNTLRFWGEIEGGLSMTDGTVPVIRAGELELEVLES